MQTSKVFHIQGPHTGRFSGDTADVEQRPEKPTGRPTGSRMEKGYGQQGLQIPEDLVREFRDEVSRLGSGGVKIAGTAAISLWLGMPKGLRSQLYLWVLQKSWDGAESIKPAEVFQKLAELLTTGDDDERSAGDVSDSKPTHYIDRVLSPEFLSGEVSNAERLANELREPPGTKRRKTAG